MLTKKILQKKSYVFVTDTLGEVPADDEEDGVEQMLIIFQDTIKNYQCEKCGKTLPEKNNLEKHVYKEHIDKVILSNDKEDYQEGVDDYKSLGEYLQSFQKNNGHPNQIHPATPETGCSIKSCSY